MLNDARFFRLLQEIGRRAQTVLRMVPAQQRLDTHDLARLRIELRLIIDFQFVVLERIPEPAFDGDLFRGGVFKLIVVKRVSVLATGFDVVHRHVGILDQGIDLRRVIGVHRDADADVDVNLLVAQVKRLLQARDQFLRHFLSLLARGRLW